MKISKSLLSAIAAGVLMSTSVSCDKTELIEKDVHLETCDENCDSNHTKSNNQVIHTYEDCPACGMG